MRAYTRPPRVTRRIWMIRVAILGHLERVDGEVTTRALATALEISVHTMWWHLRELLRDGHVARNRPARDVLWRLA